MLPFYQKRSLCSLFILKVSIAFTSFRDHLMKLFFFGGQNEQILTLENLRILSAHPTSSSNPFVKTIRSLI